MPAHQHSTTALFSSIPNSPPKDALSGPSPESSLEHLPPDGKCSREKLSASTSQHLRLCIACRKFSPQTSLLRLTVDRRSGTVALNQAQSGAARVCGRSAYICASNSCLDAALKGTRLKQALQGRKLKGAPEKRSVAWPLESQLIHTLRSKCTEKTESCQNTLRKEGC